MSRKRFLRAQLGALTVLALLFPAASPGEVVRLKDGSTLVGKLVRVEGDSLTIRLSIGVPVKIYRGAITSIAFSDSSTAPIVAPSPVVSAPATPTGVGSIVVKFEDREVSSKITIEKKIDWDAHVRSNDIVMDFVVDGVVAYTAVDTTTDKTIYLGHKKQLKNDAKLKDFTLEVPAGTRRCTLVVRNRDPDTFHDHFDPAPLNAVLELGEVTVSKGGIARVDVRVDKGLLRLSSPKLYQSGKDN